MNRDLAPVASRAPGKPLTSAVFERRVRQGGRARASSMWWFLTKEFMVGPRERRRTGAQGEQRIPAATVCDDVLGPPAARQGLSLERADIIAVGTASQQDRRPPNWRVPARARGGQRAARIATDAATRSAPHPMWSAGNLGQLSRPCVRLRRPPVPAGSAPSSSSRSEGLDDGTLTSPNPSPTLCRHLQDNRQPDRYSAFALRQDPLVLPI